MLGDRTNVQVVHPTNEAEPGSAVAFRVIVDTEWRRLVKTVIKIYQEPHGYLLSEMEHTDYISAYKEYNEGFLFPTSGYAIINAETFVCELTGCETTRDDFASATINVIEPPPPPPPPPPSGWSKVEEKVFVVQPGIVQGNWSKVEEKVFVIQPVGPSCETDTDCPPGYVCVDGHCVPEAALPPEIPWMWIGIGGASVLAAILLIPKGKGGEEKINKTKNGKQALLEV